MTLLCAHQLEQAQPHQIQQARHHDAAHGIGQLVTVGQVAYLPALRVAMAGSRPDTQRTSPGRRGPSAWCRRGTAACRDRQTAAWSGWTGADRSPAPEWGPAGGTRSAEHGKQVLQAQQEHPGDAQLTGVVDGVVSEFFVHVIVPLFRLWIL